MAGVLRQNDANREHAKDVAADGRLRGRVKAATLGGMVPATRLLALAAVVTLAGAPSACLSRAEPCAGVAVRPGDSLECPVPEWVDRGFDLEVPAGWDGRSPLPILFAFHGGGGNRRSAASVTCPDGKLDAPECLSAVAKAAGFALVRADGTGSRPARNVRTWNAGGGVGPWNCTSGGACASGVDDVRFFDDLLAEVGRVVPVDPKRVHLTGLSNGAAISHRLACERPARVASIVTLGGANQHVAAGGVCAGAVPVLHIHGTEDPCWAYETSGRSCLSEDGEKVGVAPSMEGWRLRNGCEAGTDEAPLPDRDPADGTRSVRVRWRGCAAATEHIRVTGGGHTWPSGHGYLGEDRIGRVTRDFGNEILVEFLRAHPKP
ncbi:MAG: hypothetical protein IPF92_13610 [Myxococcales bacterium]|nr:hypothetical protein [Myxococcales bacterium]